MLQLTTKLMNRFSYSIITHFIPGNKEYHFYCNPHSVYQTYPKCFFGYPMLYESLFAWYL